MRKKSLILLAFLLMLYITPMIFISSSVGVAIPTEPNMNKDFSLSGYGDESPQSITYFDETLPDDVLFSPDLGINSTKVFASAGEGLPSESGFLSNTYVDNNDNLGGYDTTSPTVANVTLDFDDIQSEAEGIYYYLNLYVHPDNDDADFWIWNYNSSDWELLIANVPTGPAYYSDSIFSTDYISSGNVSFLFNGTTTGATVGCYIQYAYLNSHIMTLADANHYAEGFHNVSDWETPATGVTGATITSDDDVATITENGPANLGIAYASFDETDYYEYYYEFSIVSMTATTAGLMFWDDTVLLNYNLLKTFTAAGTYKGIISNTDADSMVRIGFVIDSNNGDIKPDYLRISPSDEMGWQHDGSTTEGVEAFNGGSISSDGDYLSLISDADGAIFNFTIDTTTTPSAINPHYYPFIVVKIHSDDVGNDILLRAFFGSSPSTILSKFTTTSQYIRANIGAITGTGYEVFQIFTYSSQTTRVEYIKAYSIANFTVSQSGVSTNDYLYVSSGTLYSHIDSGYITLDHDPTIDLGTHYEWDMDTSLGTPEIDFYDGAWLGYTSETEGKFSIGSTVTDFRLKFTDNANIISLKFTDRTGWYDAGTVTIWFEVPVFTGSFDALLIFLGLLMIPASVLYLVKGGKDEMSNDKLFYFLIAFVIGWGLFLGGIYA